MSETCGISRVRRGGTYRVVVGKPEGTRLLGMLKRRREDDIKRDVKGVSWSALIWFRIGTGGELV
jgi:hypothetical protein